MKSSKNLRPYGNAERKIGGKREKGSKLDRKSSRGMIYENEELRLRTININAEVERGQSDIKRLRRENEQLRREIWTLRDECDRLNKRFKAKLLEHEHGSCSARHSGGSGGCGRASGHGGCDSNCNSDDSDSCDTCKGNDDQCSDDCCVGGSCPQLSTKQPIVEEPLDTDPHVERTHNAISSNHTPALLSDDEEAPPPLHAAFDHLSVVSEETLSNSELLLPATQSEQLLGYTPESGGSQMTIPSLVGPLTPLTPVELVANQLNDLQAVVPPLSYFENVVQQHMGSTIGATPTSPTSKVVKHTNGWDYNLQSPFAHRRYPASAHNTVAPPPPPPSIKRATPTQTLTTFVPTIVTPPSGSHMQPDITVTAPSSGNVETVAITTMPANVLTPASAPPHDNNSSSSSPKHFFAPLKPRLKINTALANKSLVAASVPVLPPAVPPKSNGDECRNCEPPDIFVANALASPYQRQALPNAAAAVHALPPPVPLRGSSSQTDSVNLETILNDIEAISEDILAIQLDKKSGKIGGANGVNTPLAETDKTKKPYRSEMNLTLQYDGTANPTITPSKTVTTTQSSLNDNNSTTNNNNARCTRSLEREHTESPSPRIPDPMAPFPDKHTYIGFDQLNHVASNAATNKQKPPLPRILGGVSSTPGTPLKPPPPTPPARSYPSPLNIRCAGVARNNTTATDSPSTPVIAGLAPNKSQLYSTVANAAAKRAQFRTAPSHMTRSLEVVDVAAAASNEPNSAASPDAAEVMTGADARRKARRVSIACGGEAGTPETPDVLNMPSPPTPVQLRSQAQQTSAHSTPTNATNSSNTTTTNTQQTTTTTTNAINPTTGSCLDLPLALVNPALRNLKQPTSHSTPNSPHSVRRRSNSNSADCAPQTQSANASPRHTNANVAANAHQLLQHNNSNFTNLPVSHQRKSSQDSMRGNSTELPTGEAGRTRCSRRHSDTSNAPQRVSGNSAVGGSSAHHHHHHHHHQHQHSASLLSNHLHPSHQSHQDSSSLSERGSNSSASSRESSTSFSMRSHRRKISISSHTGGKIPWCGCWGNGCL